MRIPRVKPIYTVLVAHMGHPLIDKRCAEQRTPWELKCLYVKIATAAVATLKLGLRKRND